VVQRNEDGGPNGFGLARPRMRARMFYRWLARLVSAGVGACKATDHARAGQEPRAREQCKFNL
jgi:hypothetical protein